MTSNRNRLEKLDGGILEPPFELDGEALKQWHVCAPELHRLGFLTDQRKSILAEYCVSIAAAIKADRIVSKEGLTVRSKNGHIKAHPQVAVSRKARNRALSLGQKVGIGPLSRKRLSKKDSIARRTAKRKIRLH